MGHYVGVTGRGRHQDDPLLHASTGIRRTATGRTLAAVCGAAVYEVARADLPDRFDPDHRRACPACASKVR